MKWPWWRRPQSPESEDAAMLAKALTDSQRALIAAEHALAGHRRILEAMTQAERLIRRPRARSS